MPKDILLLKFFWQLFFRAVVLPPGLCVLPCCFAVDFEIQRTLIPGVFLDSAPSDVTPLPHLHYQVLLMIGLLTDCAFFEYIDCF